MLPRLSGAKLGMLVVETIAKIRRAYFVQGKSIKAICRELRVSRKTVRKVMRSEEIAFTYQRSAQPQPKIGPWREELDRLLATNAARPSRERLTIAHSGVIRSGVPITSGQPFRFDPVTDSGVPGHSGSG